MKSIKVVLFTMKSGDRTPGKSIRKWIPWCKDTNIGAGRETVRRRRCLVCVF